MDLEIKGKVAIVTGAGQGVGKEIGRVLASEGAKVVINDFYLDRAEAAAQEIQAEGGEAVGLQGDVADLEQVKSSVAAAVETYGPVDILVNNAGVPVTVRSGEIKRKPFVEIDPANWQKDIDLSLVGCLNFSYAVLPSMIERKEGRFVNVISEAGRVGETYLSVYGAAKGGVLAFSRSLAKEVGRYAITVNCISLGAVAHEGIRHVFDPDATPETDPKLAKMLKVYPVGRGLGRIGRASDVAYAAAFLASPRACFITGQCLGVNGGFTMV
jgi:3-oxoacyl-[acyl-carrier protein] reductase